MNLYDSYIEGAQELSYRQRCAFYAAVIEYVVYQREPPSSLKGTALGMFKMLRPSLDKQIARAAAGKVGGSSVKKWKQNRSKSQAKVEAKGQAKPKQTPKQNASKEVSKEQSYQDISISIYSPSIKEDSLEEEDYLLESSSKEDFLVRGSFVPPTLEEVESFCKGNLMDKVNPQLFIAYYASQGWKKANGLAVTDWKPLVQQWNAENRNSLAAQHVKKRTGADYSEFSEDNWDRG